MRVLHRKKELMWTVVFLLLTALLLHFAANVLRPVNKTYGSTWQAFLAEPEDSLDVIYLGSSYAYCDVNPALVYKSSGLTGFVMAGGEQTLSITYWYLKEVLKAQSPAAVVLEGTGVFFKPYQNYTEPNVSLMPFSVNKLGAILTASEPELRQGLLFDLSLYHSRWKSIGTADFKRALWGAQRDEYKGFTPIEGVLDGVGETAWVSDREVAPEVYADNLTWLGKILGLCRENGIQAIVTIHPSYTRCTPETYARIGRDIKNMDPDVVFCDWSADVEKVGLIPTEHLYDGGHMNREGAAIFSAWLGRELTEKLGLTPRPQTAENAAAWQSAAEHWVDME